MSPRPGGEADKFGNRYEGAWTVRQLLYVLSGQLDSVTVEEQDPIGQGSEFTTRKDDAVNVYQIKRQHGSANHWTIASLHSKGVLTAARKHVDAGRNFHFVSTIPAQQLQELSDRARRSPDVTSFIASWLTNTLRHLFDELCAETIYGSPEASWTVLRRLYIHWPSEDDVREVNAALAGFLLQGAESHLTVVGLGDLVLHNLGARLDESAIDARLKKYGLKQAGWTGGPTLAQAVTDLTADWKANIVQGILQPEITRSEAGKIVAHLEDGNSLVFALGPGGSGKSVVLHSVITTLEERDWTVLVFRLDRRPPFSSTIELGKQLGLSLSPASGLAKAAGGGRAVLVIDQLDAISMASGRIPETFEIIVNLIREARAFSNVQVLLACRKFDADNDHRIRTLSDQTETARVDILELSDEQVVSAVASMDINSASLTDQQKAILQSPLHLVLLKSIAKQGDPLSFTSTTELFDEFWRRKYLECRLRRSGPPRFNDVVRVLAEQISARQRLTVPLSVLDPENLLADAYVLASEHVLTYTSDNREIGFFHESFFDYAFARVWIERGETLVAFLVNGEQGLFQRGQVRQVLTHLRERDPDRFVEETEALIANTSIRFHIKDVALAVLRSLPDPTPAEWEMIEGLLETHPPFEDKLWSVFRTSPWFDRLDTEGVMSNWLVSNDSRHEAGVLNIFAATAKERPDQIAELLEPLAGRTEKYPNWLLWVVRFAEVHESRRLFDLLLDAIRSGSLKDYGHNLWMFLYDLAKCQPSWAVEALAVHLVIRPGALRLDDNGTVETLSDRDDAIIRMVSQAAEGAPKDFCELLIPYMLAVMRVTAYETADGLAYDRHFCHRYPKNDHPHQVEDALIFSAAEALRRFVSDDPDTAKSLLGKLAADPHDAAQWILYEGLQGSPRRFAEWAADLILQDRKRFLSGYVDNGVWTTRLLIQAISPQLLDDTFLKLERAILDVRFPWEKKQPGWYAFNLLSAMDETRLSEAGRRRLGELRRLRGTQEPPEPVGIEFGTVAPPVPPEAAQHMTDEQWLRAIARHNADCEDWATFRGGAREQAQVLQAASFKDPARFAALALRLTLAANPAYGAGILQGLAHAEALPDPTPIFDAIRHIASFQHDSNDGLLGLALRRYLGSDIPDDLIQLVIDRALHAADPPSDTGPDRAEETPHGQDEAVYSRAINSARGQAAEVLGDIVANDADGSRTSLVLPVLDQLADDPSIAVRSCVAHVISACLRHARPAATEAFTKLVQANERLLACRHVYRLIMYLGNGGAVDVVRPTIERMLASNVDDVGETGGRLAAFAGLEWTQGDLLLAARSSERPTIRKGVASLCANYLPRSTDTVMTIETLKLLINDPEDGVRQAVAEVAARLRDERLRPYTSLLSDLISSDSYTQALPQLLITLEHAPDRVDKLAIKCAKRFVAVFGTDASDMSTRAAGEAREVGQLVLRAYTQATSTAARRGALDLVDELLMISAIGFTDLVSVAERE